MHDDDVRPSLWPHLLTSPFPPRFRQDLMDGSKGETSPHISENGGAAHQVAAWRTSFLASKAVRLNEFTTRTTLAGVGKREAFEQFIDNAHRSDFPGRSAGTDRTGSTWQALALLLLVVIR
ncbi:UNVERIFIED_ORG: hypothetical protein GGI63_000864 [Rhizobium esperanzae]